MSDGIVDVRLELVQEAISRFPRNTSLSMAASFPRMLLGNSAMVILLPERSAASSANRFRASVVWCPEGQELAMRQRRAGPVYVGYARAAPAKTDRQRKQLQRQVAFMVVSPRPTSPAAGGFSGA